MGSIYIAKGKLDSAKVFLDRALEVGTRCEDVVVLSTVYKDLGQLYSKQNKASDAKEALTKALTIGQQSNLRVENKEHFTSFTAFIKELAIVDKQ